MLGVVREDDDEDAACAPGRVGCWRRINHALVACASGESIARRGGNAVEVTLDDRLGQPVILQASRLDEQGAPA